MATEITRAKAQRETTQVTEGLQREGTPHRPQGAHRGGWTWEEVRPRSQAGQVPAGWGWRGLQAQPESSHGPGTTGPHDQEEGLPQRWPRPDN